MTTSISAQLDAVAALPRAQERAVSSLLGAAVADAAARPLHWVYDMELMEELMKDGQDADFWPESMSPFYTLPTGARSCYNHVVMAGLQAFVEADGEADLDVYRAVIRRTFGEGTAWQEALARRKEAYTPAKRREKRETAKPTNAIEERLAELRKAFGEPVEGPWLHGAVIHLLDNGEAEAGNTEMDAFLLCLPHLLFRANRPGVLEECLTIASLLTGVTTWVTAQLEVVRAVLEMGGLSRESAEELEVEEEAWAALEQVWERIEEDHIKVVSDWGNNCHQPGSVQGALHAFVRYLDVENSEEGNVGETFKSAVRETIKAGGCNCSRCNFLGSLMGARAGLKSLPTEWLERVTDLPTLLPVMLKAAKISEQ